MQKDLYFIIKKAGAAIGGAINALFNVKPTIKLKTIFFGIIGQAKTGIKLRQSNFILLLKNVPSLKIITSAVGSLKKERQNIALAISSVNSGSIETTQVPAFDLLRLSYNLNRLVGGNSINLTTNNTQGWENEENAISGTNGKRNGSVALFSGNVLASRSGNLLLAYEDLINKDELSIQSVKLKFYYQVSGTTLNNADVRLFWGKNGVYFTLSTIAGNKNALTVPDEFDITTEISSWDDINSLETIIFCGSTATETWTCRLDAIEIEILANKIDII